MSEKRTIDTQSGTLEEGVHFFYFKDGNGVEHPVAKLDHKIWEERRIGKISLQSFRVSRNAVKEENSVYSSATISAFKDLSTGVWFGIPIGVNQNTNGITWQQISLDMVEEFDLSNPRDRERWVVLSRSPIVEGSPNQVSGKPLYKVFDFQAKAQKRLEEYTLKDRSIEIIKGLDEYELRDAAIPLKINAAAFDPVTLRSELRFVVEKNFKDFLNFWESPTRHAAIVFHKAVHRGVINRVLQGGQMMYTFGAETLGITETDSIAYISMPERAVLYKSIVVATETAEKEQKVSKNSKIPMVDIKNQEVEDLKKQVELLTKALLDKNKEGDVASSAEPNLDFMPESELKDLAKDLKIKGYASMKPGTLKKAIKDAQSLV